MRAGLSWRDVVGEVFTVALLVAMAFFGARVVTPWEWRLLYWVAPSAMPAGRCYPIGEVVYVMHMKIDAKEWLEIAAEVAFLLSFTGFFGLWWLILQGWRQDQRG